MRTDGTGARDSALDVVTFGEAMLLLVADRPGPLEDAGAFHKRTAGAETNVAIGLARLGLKVGWASRLGTDMMGRYLIKAMIPTAFVLVAVQGVSELLKQLV